MAYGDSNGHVTDDVTHVTWKVKLVTPTRLEPNISKQLEMLFSNNHYYTVSQKTCDYIFYNKFNNISVRLQ